MFVLNAPNFDPWLTWSAASIIKLLNRFKNTHSIQNAFKQSYITQENPIIACFVVVCTQCIQTQSTEWRRVLSRFLFFLLVVVTFAIISIQPGWERTSSKKKGGRLWRERESEREVRKAFKDWRVRTAQFCECVCMWSERVSSTVGEESVCILWCVKRSNTMLSMGKKKCCWWASGIWNMKKIMHKKRRRKSNGEPLRSFYKKEHKRHSHSLLSVCWY